MNLVFKEKFDLNILQRQDFYDSDKELTTLYDMLSLNENRKLETTIESPKRNQIETQDKKLVDIIYDSFENTRGHICFNPVRNPFLNRPFLSLLRDITGLTGLTVDMMRSSYEIFLR